MHAASFVATGFSIVTTLERTRIIAEHLVRNYGMEHHCRGVRATDIPVLELENPKSNARAMILAECERAITEDKSGAIVLGCAGMADLNQFLEERLGVPVIDGVTAAVKFAEALVSLGLRTSKRGDLAFPLHKPYKGALVGLCPAASRGKDTRGGLGRLLEQRDEVDIHQRIGQVELRLDVLEVMVHQPDGACAVAALDGGGDLAGDRHASRARRPAPRTAR